VTQPLQPTRRSVVRTAAWTAPAIAVATAAPALAASVTAGARVTLSAAAIQVSGAVLRFATDLANPTTFTTTNLTVSVVVTAPSAASWGANPTASLTNFANGQTQTSANWTFVSVSGTGASRTFTFDAVTEFGPGRTSYFDYQISTGAGAIGPGTLVRTTIPGSPGTSTSLTTSYAATAARTAASSQQTRG
jgi:hypothetical protein